MVGWRFATLLLEISSPNLADYEPTIEAWYQFLLTPYVASMVRRAFEVFKQYRPGQRNHFWLRQLTVNNYFFYRVEELNV